MVAILVPAYGAADKLRVCLKSLSKYAPFCPVFVLDDGTPNDSIARCCKEESFSNLTYVRSDVNRGFVATCNWGWKQVAPPGVDILLLNSDTEVTEGFLQEMVRVLHLFERHGVVTPRTNHATIFSVPLNARDVSPAESYSIWQELQSELPEYGIMPTAVGFCLLIKARILEQFGLFDEIYSPGYNEENDFVCRINRYGYSAVVANRAFVYHYEGATFGSQRNALEARHNRILTDRYPEYERKVADYLAFELDPVEKFAILRRTHRPSVLYDLFHLPPKHNGSSEFALGLLRELYLQTEDCWDLTIGLSEEARFFTNELTGYRVYADSLGTSTPFDLVFKPAQIFTWAEFRRLNNLAPRISLVLQDIIAVRSEHLAYPARKTIFERTFVLADQVFSISDFSAADFESYYRVKLGARTIHHGTNAGVTPSESMQGEYVLVVGNHFLHKGVREALACLTDVGPVRVIGGDKPAGLPEQIQCVTSGKLTRGLVRELYARASVLVYPSHYEGFGLPIVEGLALGKPVVALDNDLNRELSASLANENFVLVNTLSDLQPTVKRLLSESHHKVTLPLEKIRRWSDVAKEYVAGLQQLLDRPQDAAKMRARMDLIRVLNSAGHL